MFFNETILQLVVAKSNCANFNGMPIFLVWCREFLFFKHFSLNGLGNELLYSNCCFCQNYEAEFTLLNL